MILLSSADFFQNFPFQKIISGTLSEYLDQDRRSVGPGLDPNCLQRIPAGDKVATSKERTGVVQS